MFIFSSSENRPFFLSVLCVYSYIYIETLYCVNKEVMTPDGATYIHIKSISDDTFHPSNEHQLHAIASDKSNTIFLNSLLTEYV